MSIDKDILKTSSEEDDEFVSCHQCQKMLGKNEKNESCLKRCHFVCPICIQSLMTSSDAENEFVCSLCKLTESMVAVLNDRSVEHKHQVNQINAACDHALTDCHQIQAAHQIIIAWVGWLLNQINEWDSSNNTTIAQLKSLKVLEEFPVKQEQNLQCTINKINELIVQLKDKFKEVQAFKLKISRQLHMYCHCHGSDELTFSTSQTNENESCISALAFLISYLGRSEKEGEQVSNHGADEAGIRQVGKNEDVLNRAQLEADLELLAKQLEQAKESEISAKQQAWNQMERANKAQEKVLQMVQSHQSEMEKLRYDYESLEKRFLQKQIEVEKMKEDREKIGALIMETNTEFVTIQTKLTEEARLAKEQTDQLKSKLAETEKEKRLEEEQMLELDKIKDDQEKKKSRQHPVEEHAESYHTLPTKKIKLQGPIDKLQLISTENVMCKVVCGVQETKQCVLIGHCETKNGLIINENGRELFVFYNVFNFREILLHLVRSGDIAMSKLFSCMNCKKQISKGFFFYCLDCDNYQLCSSCAHVKHDHKIQKFGFKERCNQYNKIRLTIWVTSFLHSITCLNKECVFPSCEDLKRSFDHKHIHNCVTCEISPNTKCPICKQLVTILFYHAKSCTNISCRVPYCGTTLVRQLINNF